MASHVIISEDFFVGCSNLLVVKINKCKLSSLPESLFKDTFKLEEMDFSYNYITSLPSKFLHAVPKLREFIFNRNSISIINDDHFKFSHNLVRIQIMHNSISHLSIDSLRNLNDLEELNLSFNRIYFNNDKVPKFGFMTKLKILNLSNNNISIHDIPQSVTFSLPKLSIMDFSHNKLGPILNVSDLHFAALTPNLMVNLSFNSFNIISYDLPEKLNFPSSLQTNIIVDISENPITCDCRNADLASHLKNQLLNHVATTWFKFSQENEVTCGDSKNSLSTIDVETMTCNFPSNFLNYTCPDECQCQLATYEKNDASLDKRFHVILKCHNFPDQIPNLSKYYRIQDVTLNMSKSNITSVFNLTVIGQYDLVTQLAIDHNQINNIDPRILKNLTKMWIGNNPYQCNCDSKDLFRFVQKNLGSKIQDSDAIALECPEGPKKIHDIPEYNEFCVETKEVIINIILSVFFIILLLLVGIVIFLRYKQRISIWIYSKPALRNLIFTFEDDPDKPFDVFISYSNEDADFVEGSLVPILEDKNSEYNYRCLVHIRDFVPGRPIMDQIFDAVDSSKCTLIILSKNFIESDWARHE